MADVPGDSSTTSVIAGSGQTASELETNGDIDWFRVTLTAGLTYDFTLTGDGGPTSLGAGRLRLLDATGASVETNVGKNAALSFTPATGGIFYVAIEDSANFNGQPEGTYLINARMDDTVVSNVTTTARIAGTGTTSGVLGQSLDADWYAVTLKEGLSYGFVLGGTGGAGSLDAGRMRLREANGVVIDSVGKNETLDVTASQTGTYYISVEDGFASDREAEGDFRITAVMTDTIFNNTATTAELAAGGRLTGRIDVQGDADWYEAATAAGRTYTFSLAGTGGASALEGKRLILRDADGDVIATASDTSGVKITYKAATGGPVYLDVQGQGADTGRFQLSVVSDARTLKGDGGNNFLAGGNNATRISGLGGADTLLGNGGRDRLDGGAGNDLLTGGRDRDVFVFDRGSDRDRILDFRNNVDTIRLEDLGVSSVRRALAEADQVGRNVVFDFGRGDTLTVLGTTKAQLADDLLIG